MPMGGQSNDGRQQQRDPFSMPMGGQSSDGRPQQNDPFGMPMGGQSSDGRPQQNDPSGMPMGGQWSDGRPQQLDPFSMPMGGQSSDGLRKQRDPFRMPFVAPSKQQQQQQQRDPFEMSMDGQSSYGRQHPKSEHVDMPMGAQTFGGSRQPRELFDMAAVGESSFDGPKQHGQSVGRSTSRYAEQQQRNSFELPIEARDVNTGELQPSRSDLSIDTNQQSGGIGKQNHDAKEDSRKSIDTEKLFDPFASESRTPNERELNMPIINSPIEPPQVTSTDQEPDKLLNSELHGQDRTDFASSKTSQSFVKQDPMQQRWVIDQNGVPETMADKAREHSAAPESSLQRSEDHDAQAVTTYLASGENATALVNWGRAWSALFPDAADRLLPGIGAELHKVVSDSLPRNPQGWLALSAALQNEGLGCEGDIDRLCAQNDAVGCLVQLSAKSSANCQRVLSPSLFGSCLGELPECALHFVPALPCLAKQADDGSDCSVALGKVHELRKSLPAVLQEVFSQSDLRTEARSDVTTYAAWGFLMAICIAGVGVAANPTFSVTAWKVYDDHKSHLLNYRDKVARFIKHDGLLAKGDESHPEERPEDEASPEPESEQVGLLQ
jgi:hypothetical protein